MKEFSYNKYKLLIINEGVFVTNINYIDKYSLLLWSKNTPGKYLQQAARTTHFTHLLYLNEKKSVTQNNQLSPFTPIPLADRKQNRSFIFKSPHTHHARPESADSALPTHFRLLILLYPPFTLSTHSSIHMRKLKERERERERDSNPRG